MVHVIEQQTITTGHWRELWSARYLRTSALVAGSVALYATNEFLTISLLPSTVDEIGGERIYAWVTTLYLVGSVVAAATVNSMLRRFGTGSCYLLGFGVLAAGSLVCALAPSMEILLAGRTLQGLAGGLLAGLSYAVINAVLPRSLWGRGTALATAMWGIGIFLGPAVGGFFAQFGAWRWAFGVLGLMSMAMALLVPGALSAGCRGQAGHSAETKIPVRSVVLLGVAALAVSVACLPRNPVTTAALLAVGGVLVGVFLVLDRRAPTAVLPASVYGSGPLKWIYLTLGLLAAATKVDMYVPLFGQRLAHLPPLMAGFLGASLSLGWIISDIGSASMNNLRTIARVVTAGPLVMGMGLAVAGATHVRGVPVGLLIVCALALLVSGVGIGVASPHLSAWAMGRVDDPAEGAAAAAGINSVQLIFGAFGAGLAGVVVNITDGGPASVAHMALTVFALLAAAASVTAYCGSRPQVPQ